MPQNSTDQFELPCSPLPSLSCENFQCKSIYFKCPNYYCVPWRVFCNGVWDCPWGADQTNCTRTSCPRQFRCHNTSTCIAPDSICDGVQDCLIGDDEYFCFPKLPPCPENCTCILYSISCFQSTFEISNSNVHIHLKMDNSSKQVLTHF